MKTVLVFTGQTTAAFERLNAAFMDYARSRGWRLQTVAVNMLGCNPEEILSVVQPDGALVYCAHGIPARPDRRKIPSVFVNLNAKRSALTIVRHDSHATGCRAADELLRLGYASYGVLPWETPVDWSSVRCRAFAERLKSLGEVCHRFSGGWERRSPALARQAIGAWLRTLPRPSGIFAANDLAAEMVVSAAQDVGLSVPADVSVLGVDDNLPVCENAPVSISSIRPDFAKGGRMAADLLGLLMARPNRAPEVRVYDDECIVRRGSTRVLAHADPRVLAALEYIRRNACSGIGVADVVARMDCARRSAELAFRRSAGVSILEAINDVRLARAKELLADPRQAIGAIPQKCGWCGANFLMRLFKAKTGMTMRAWRQRHAQ